ncbi:hypothetical protein D3C79_1121280 [compost metagenome]
MAEAIAWSEDHVVARLDLFSGLLTEVSPDQTGLDSHCYVEGALLVTVYEKVN